MWQIPRWILYILLGVVGLVGAVNILILFWIIPLVNFDGWVVRLSPDYRDSLHLAMEIGRLDAISALLTILGIALGILALVGFGYVRIKAEVEAREEAKRRVNEMLPDMVPPLVAEHLGMILGIGDSTGDQVAEHASPEDGNGQDPA